MTTVSYIKESKQSISAMRGLMKYCLQDKKVRDPVSGRRLVGGVNCNGENAFICRRIGRLGNRADCRRSWRFSKTG